MKAKSADRVVGDWRFELKWDGMRHIAFITPQSVRLQSTNLRTVTNSFPELAAMATLGADLDGLVLDGETVAFDENGLPSFNALQRRMHVSDPAEARRRSATTPVLFIAFDILHVDGHDTFALPLEDRRTLLEQVFEGGPHWMICEQHDGDMAALLDVVETKHLEGIVAKRPKSTYQPGKRSADWVKIKPRQRQEFVVGGWLMGQGNRKGKLGSLLVGVYEGDQLLFAGRAGSGLNESDLQDWQAALTASTECPFAEAPDMPRDRTYSWCEPLQVAEIAFGEWKPGHQFRHPVVLGRRIDKDPRSVIRESP